MAEIYYVAVALTQNLDKDILGVTRRGSLTIGADSHHLWDDENDAWDLVERAERSFGNKIYPCIYVETIRV